MTDERTDRELISAHVGGDPNAFGTLFARHQDRLWAVALRTTHDPEDASDGLQDAMISALRNAGAYRGDAAVTTWLHRIVVNACLDRLRRRRARPTVPLPGTDLDREDDMLADPADDIGTAELRHELQRALAALPEDQRMAIVLVDVNGFRVDEAAEILGVPSGTIKSRCARGRAKLAARLEPLRPTAARTTSPPTGGLPPDRNADAPDSVLPDEHATDDGTSTDTGAHPTAQGGDTSR